MSRLLALLALLVALAAPAIAEPDPCPIPGAEPVRLGGDDSGIGGTGHGEDGGIGGTGRGEDGGIGGTGRGGDDSGIGGTGVFGTVTEVNGGLCVNGLRIGIDASTPVSVRGVATDTAELAVGQVVWLEARTGQDGLEAQTVSIYSAAFGPITQIDPRRRLVRVGVHEIEVPEAAPVFDRKRGRGFDFGDLEPGMVVAVSALPTTSGRFEATRIERDTPERRGSSGLPELSSLVRAAPEIARLSAEGHVRGRVGPRTLRLDGLEIELPERPRRPERFAPNERIWVSGALADRGVLRVERLQMRPGDRPPERVRPALEPADPPRSKPPTAPDRPEPVPRPPDRPAPVPRPPDRPTPIDRPPVIDRLDRPEPILRLEPARD